MANNPSANERQWDGGAWLTLAVALLLILAPASLVLSRWSAPTDGWLSKSADGTGSGPYTMQSNLSGLPSPLREGDRVIAIDGRELAENAWPPLPPDLEVGQTLRYTVVRDDATLDLDVTLVSLPRLSFLTAMGRAATEDLAGTLIGLLSLTLAIGVFALRPGSVAARYLLLMFAYFFGSVAVSEAARSVYRYQAPPLTLFMTELASGGWLYVFIPAVALLAMSFPVRKWPVRRYPRLTPGLLFAIPLIAGCIWLGAVVVRRSPAVGSAPLTIVMLGSVAVVCLGTALVSLIHNFLTVRDPLARAQLRWIGLGLGVGYVLPLFLLFITGTWFVGTPLQRLTLQLLSILPILLPLSLAVGILRYRLFDIDVIIRKTTSYAILTALLALVYFGSIVVLQRVLSPVTGESTIAVVLSTLLIAALFLPLRRRVQGIIDRRFFRQKYNAEQVLARFAATARDETDLDALTAELVRVIQETMQPETVSVWLREPDK